MSADDESEATPRSCERKASMGGETIQEGRLAPGA